MSKRSSDSSISSALVELDEGVELAHKRIAKAKPQARDLVIVKARQVLSELITDELIERVFCPLICTSHGPSCDRDPLTTSEPYPLKVYRRCWVEALLNQWKLSELHIHNGQAFKKWPPLKPPQRRSKASRQHDEDWTDEAEAALAMSVEGSQA